MNQLKLREMLKGFLLEDIGDVDRTSEGIFLLDSRDEGVFIAKADGVFAGGSIIKEAYALLDRSITITQHISDGGVVHKGDVIATIAGPIRHLLTGERVILNCIGRMSGIATMTNQCILALQDPSIHICDTRKTMPGMRMLDKYSVLCGGGRNHRFGLSDGVMIKDNHIAYCGSITKAITKVRETLGHMVKVEVETETEDQVLEACSVNADIIMFDNRTPKEVKQLQALVPDSIITEASGGIHLENLSAYRGTGVNYISLGFLTHSVKELDISFQVTRNAKVF